MLLSLSAANVFAQSSLIATLSHNDTISVFYGIDALQEAYNQSVDGDAITLSSGNFYAPSPISKNISIYGAGMEQDSVNNIQPTVLLNNFTITAQSTESNRLTLESLWHGGIITCGITGSDATRKAAKGVQFVKCRFEGISSGFHSTANFTLIYDFRFVQCKIKGITALGNATFINSYVGAPGRTYTNSNSSSFRMNYECINCVVYGSLADAHVNYSTFTNCVLIGSKELDATNMASNCIGIYTGDISGTDLFANLPQSSNVRFTKSSDVFKTFRSSGSGNVKDTDNFELLDVIKEKYLGTDGKEIGMYGGNLPFNPHSLSPKIKKFNVASKSTADGKLSVDIEVDGVE